ncbi:UNVERIFIED_CONTAM: hypothetical protein FKN15_049454 [Acipenser sinensis]
MPSAIRRYFTTNIVGNVTEWCCTDQGDILRYHSVAEQCCSNEIQNGFFSSCRMVPSATPLSRKRARASLSDISTTEDIEGLNVRQLKEILARNFVNYSGCCEKWELLERVNRLYRETEENRKSLENVDNSKTADDEKMHLNSDDNLCRICMDAVIDCVLLECGHMVTCTKCGKRMSECPICRQYVVRAVHVFKS